MLLHRGRAVWHSHLASSSSPFLSHLPSKLNVAAARSFCWAYVACLMGLCVLPAAAGGAVYLGHQRGASPPSLPPSLSHLLKDCMSAANKTSSASGCSSARSKSLQHFHCHCSVRSEPIRPILLSPRISPAAAAAHICRSHDPHFGLDVPENEDMRFASRTAAA